MNPPKERPFYIVFDSSTLKIVGEFETIGRCMSLIRKQGNINLEWVNRTHSTSNHLMSVLDGE